MLSCAVSSCVLSGNCVDLFMCYQDFSYWYTSPICVYAIDMCAIETWRAHVQTCAMQICAIGICAIEIVLFRKDFIVLDPTQRTLSNIITTICTVGKGKRFSPISHIDFAYYCNVRYLAKIAFPSQLHIL